jgi:hypothetical protein
MLELPHAIVGATIATKVSNPFLSLPLAFLSHFLLDILPHWNPHIFTEMQASGKISKKSVVIIFLDALMALLFGLFLAFRFWPKIDRVTIILLGSFLAVAPDLIEAPYFFLRAKNEFLLKLIKFQNKVQWKTRPLVGIISQIAVLFLCWLALR